MKPQEIVEKLKQVPLFEDLTDERGELELYRLAKLVQVQTYNRGEWLFQQGELSDRLYFILDGRVRLTHIDQEGRTHQVGDLTAGDSMGETGLLVGEFHDVTAVAVEDTRVLFLLHEDFEAVSAEHNYLRRHLNVRPEIERRQDLPDFEWLRDDEWVIFAVRRHWSRLFRQTVPPVLLLLLLLPVFYALATASGVILTVAAVIVAIPILALFLLISWEYLNWRDDFFVLTTQRVVHIERVWPFSENFEETFLDNVEDIYEVRPGLPANLLNYGNLVLQTAGETVQVDMSRVPHPSHLREVIFRQIERSQALTVLQTQSSIRRSLAQRLEVGELPPPETPDLAPEPTPRANIIKVIFSSLWDYLFPPAWSVSEDGKSIVWRRFWIPGFVRYLRIFLPLAILTIGGTLYFMSNLRGSGILWLFFLWLFMEALLFGGLLWFIEDWRNDYFQLTPSRIVLVEQKPLLLQSSRKETLLDNIQNISFEIPNILARLMDYGHVVLETAGPMGRFELRWLRHPQQVQSKISEHQLEHSQQQQEAEVQRRQEELLSWFATYDRIRSEEFSSGSGETSVATQN
jgi:hypothetical protein